MNKRFLTFMLVGLILALALGACGETATPSGGGANNMPGMTMQLGQTMASTTSNNTTIATGATNSSAGSTTPGSMPGMTMQPGQTVAGTSGQVDAMTASLQNLTGKDFEVKFMQDMIAHHQGAVDMAKLVATNTKRPELLQLSQDIIAAQNKEITQQTGWLASWYNEKPLANSMDAPGMIDMMGGMDKLKAAKDAEFDKLFMMMMTPHHQAAVSMANLIPGKTQRPELIKLGQDIVTSQTTEIQQMQGWLKAWFNS